MSRFIEVLFDLPRVGSFTYRNSDEKPASTGRRVVAPLGAREATGYVVGEPDATPIEESKLKRITRTIDAEALFDEASVELARWLSGMYFCGQGEALAAMLPSGRRPPRGRRSLASGGGSYGEATEDAGADPSGAAEEEDSIPPPSDSEMEIEGIDDLAISAEGHELSTEQREALDRITRKESGSWYLYGLTGTGKTEVFLRAAEATLAEGRGVIYLVPEIALTGQVVEAATLRFGETCAVLHSRLTGSERLIEWRRILRGEARVVIGARSAIFAPVKRLGLIVIDEEHEGGYKSGASPRYHARQVAMRRRAVENARLVMGSATPSVEAWDLMTKGGIERLTLTRRLAGGAVPGVEIVDMRLESGPISRRLAEAIREAKAAGRQSILFLNRRGFAYFYHCNTCGHEIRCKHCSVALTYHKDRNALVCHYCGFRSPPPTACPACGSLDVGWSGFGTERIEEEAARIFPGFRIRRLDADSVSRRGELESIISDFKDGRTDILLGTQMVAKGLNFPGVKTVGVVLADTTLNLPDFRAAERAFSLIVQVAGRAGRFSPDGQVIVQTYRPESPVIRAASAIDLDSFYSAELSTRAELGFPPFGRLIRVVLRSKDRDRTVQAAHEFAALAAEHLPGEAELLGPAECPLGMVAGTYRWQVIVRSMDFAPAHRAFSKLIELYRPASSVRIEVDVDPVSLM
ncbi:MAG TPA: primosomal protein N' [Rectinemataceae bacterium]|nr:primosomal protein N' [Rectinemataceae bacterium]